MLQDLQYTLRTLRRAPGFAASAILALALGIGANTAVFSVVYAVLLEPLPYDQPDRLVRLSEARGAVDSGVVSAGTFVDWRGRSRTLENLAFYSNPAGGATLWSLGDRFEVVKTAVVSPALFSVLRVAPVLGRTFRPEHEQDKPSGDRGKIIISYNLWQHLFGGAPDVVGRTVSVEGRFPGEIIGVMPRRFGFPEGADAWANVAFPGPVPPAQRRARSYLAIARLRAGVTIEDARAELQDISAQLAIEQPASNAGWTARIVAQAGSDTAAAKPALFALFAAVMGVLLIGCASVANLLLARAAARHREMAVRAALGAGTFRLVRHSFIEALLLSGFGTAAGLVVAQWLTAALIRLAPPDIPRIHHVSPSAWLLLFGAAAGLVTAALIGVAPALHTARADWRGSVRSDSRSATPHGGAVRRWLIAGEVAVVVLLLTSALLLLRTFVKLRAVDLGFEPSHVVEVSTRWPVGRLFPSTPGVRPWPRIQRAVDGLIEAVGTVPGVEAVGLISDVPLNGDAFSGTVWRADAPGAFGLTPPADVRDRWSADISIVTPGYFTAMGIPVLRGRSFSDRDRLSDDQLNDSDAPRAGVVVVNRAFASRYFGGEDPIGRTLVLHDDQEFGWARTIIGVVADVRGRSVAEPAAPAIFVPHAQHPDVFVPSLIVRSKLPRDAIAAALRERITAYDSQLLVQGIRPMDDVVSGALSRPRFNLILLCAFALVALALSAVGIYGVLAWLVAQRTREIGIRMALGARTAHVIRLVLREGMTPVGAGAVAGLCCAVLVTRGMRSLLFGVTPLDPVSFVAAPVVLGAVALLACYVPARRATRTDPIVALRAE